MSGKAMQKTILCICMGILLVLEMGTSVQAATPNKLSYYYSRTSEAYAIQGYTPSDNEANYTDTLVVPNIFSGVIDGTTYTGPVVQVNASVFKDHKFQYIYFKNESDMVLKDYAFQNVEVKSPENSSDSDDGCIVFCGKVKRIGAYAFNNIKIDGYLDFRGGVDTIGDYAMSNMQIKGLKSDSIRVLGKGAFSNNAITSWYDTDGLETVGDNAFEYCTKLTEMKFPDTVTSIGAECFKGCTSLTKVMLPANAELTIGEEAFPNQEGLVIVIPSTITDISNYHFESLSNVVFQVEGDCSTTIIQYFNNNEMQYKEGENGEVVKGSNESGGSQGGGNESGGNEPGGSETGGNETGGNESAGSESGGSTSGSGTTPTAPAVETPKKGKTYKYKNMYYKVTGSTTVTFMKPVSKKVKKITIPSKVTILGKSFKVTKINKKACYGCTKVTSVSIGNYVTSIGEQAFAKCSKLKTVTIGTGLKRLGKKTFYNDKVLKKITIKSSKLTSIGKGTLRGVKKVSIKVPKKKKQAYYKLFTKAK